MEFANSKKGVNLSKLQKARAKDNTECILVNCGAQTVSEN